MFESIITIVPVELRPMSVISLILIIILASIIKMNMATVKTLREELNETKQELDKAKDHLNDQIKDIVLSLKVDVTELKGSLRNVSSCLSNMKTDIRDLRNKKKWWKWVYRQSEV